MRKEISYAIIGGILLGLIVAFGVWRVNSTMTKEKNSRADLATPTPQSGITTEFKIVLDKPEEDDVVTSKTVTVTGITKAQAWVTLSGESGDYTVQSDSTGVFSQDVDLVPGVNQIKVTAFNTAGGQSATQVLVVYSSSFQTKTLPVGSPDAAASGASDIRAKVAEDVANAMSRPKAYIGTVTDVTDSTIEIKTQASEIKQISVSTGTSVTNSTGATAKTVKTTDIAIGDFIVAIGYVDGNSVLTAQRILVTNAITEPKITVSEAKVTNVTKKALTVNTVSDNSQDTVTPDKNTDIEAIANGTSKAAKFSSISANDTIIYVKVADDKGVTSVRSIFDISTSQS